ncbi:hypothetical protein [Vreelandella massiliensis]|uniref:hypothetical protein n=1 Tax=Vreelandella massiliensis TaxID=1816686 RepID=UPI00096A903D|nr:hypothetical protein [Halomonas massiliensis]
MKNDNTLSSQELTLVALAALLLKRWKLILVVALAVFIPFTVYGFFLTPNVVQYTTLYHVAERDAHTPLRPIPDTQRRMESVYSRAARDDLGVGFGVSTAHPRNTLQIALKTVAAPGNTERVSAFHQRIITLLEASDRERLERRQQAWRHAASFTLHPELEETVSLRGAQEARMGEMLLTTQAGGVPRLSRPWAWPMLGAILGVIVGIVAACIASFGGHVARHLREST